MIFDDLDDVEDDDNKKKSKSKDKYWDENQDNEKRKMFSFDELMPCLLVLFENALDVIPLSTFSNKQKHFYLA